MPCLQSKPKTSNPMTNKPMFSQLNALSLAGQLRGCVAGVGGVRALQSLWQHPVIHCILSNNLFGASVVFPADITEKSDLHNATAVLCYGKYQCRTGAGACSILSSERTNSPCPTHTCQPPVQALASIALLSSSTCSGDA